MSNKYVLSNENILRAREDKDFMGELIIANDNLIWFAVHKYVGNPEALIRMYSVDKNDIVQTGRMAFIKAIYSFDTERDIKFTSFVVIAIVREIKNYLRDFGSVLKLTRSATVLKKKLNNIENDNEVMPPISSLVEITGAREEKIRDVLVKGRDVKYLEEGVADDICDNKSDEEIENIFVKNILNIINTRLNDTERQVFKMKLNTCSNVEISNALNISTVEVAKHLRKISNIVNSIL